MSEATIKRRDALIEMDIHETRGHKVNTFSIQFYKKNGELVSLIRAKSCGLQAHMGLNRLRGVQAVDFKGNNIGHPYPVCIDNIRMLNGKRVHI
jgi:hypothetical protein